MPTKCSVRGCDNFYMRGKSFFDLPSPLKYKFSEEKAALSRKRRRRWLAAMRMRQDLSEVLRICDKHFVKGKPAALEDYKDVDWVPSLNMNLPDLPQDRKPKSTPGNKEKGKIHLKKTFPPPVENKKNNTHKRIDLKKFLNCKVLLDGNIHSSKFNGTNGSGLATPHKHGYFTSGNVKLQETALNNMVLRVHLIRDNLNDLKHKYQSSVKVISNKRKRKTQQVSSFGREIKKKMHFFDYNETTNETGPMMKQNQSLDNNAVKTRSYSSLSNTEIKAPVKNQSVDNKKMSLHNKLQNKSTPVRYSFSENTKTLNRSIKKIDKDKIRVKLFSKATTPVKRINLKRINLTPTEQPLQLRREILFVKQYKNERLWNKDESTYYLKFPCYRYHEDGKLNYPFQKLIIDIKHMRLPGPTWKIKVIIKQGKISAITFTNKLSLERCVGFSANNDSYSIIIDNRPASLIGSPNSVHNATELETLLEIVENIEPNNPMIYYK